MIEKQLWHPVALAERCRRRAAGRAPAGRQTWCCGATPRAPCRPGPTAARTAARSCRSAAWCLRGRHARSNAPTTAGGSTAGGRCVQVPALPDFVPPATHRAATHAAQEAHGLVWVRLDRRGRARCRPSRPKHDAHLRKLNCGPYEVETSAPRLVENFLDMAHFGFVHEGWLGARDMTAHRRLPRRGHARRPARHRLQGLAAAVAPSTRPRRRRSNTATRSPRPTPRC